MWSELENVDIKTGIKTQKVRDHFSDETSDQSWLYELRAHPNVRAIFPSLIAPIDVSENR